MFHSIAIENDFWAPQSEFCDYHITVCCRSISENDICVIFKSQNDFCFDIGVKIGFESGKITVQIQRNLSIFFAFQNLHYTMLDLGAVLQFLLICYGRIIGLAQLSA